MPNPFTLYKSVGVFKKTKKLIKPRKSEKKNNRKNRTVKKNRLKFWKNRPVRFGFDFLSLEPEKPNRTRTEKTGKNGAKPKKPSQTGLNRFCSKKPNRNRSVWTGFSFFFLKFGLVTFFDKNRTEPKINTPTNKKSPNNHRISGNNHQPT